jgi:hypothetical protein
MLCWEYPKYPSLSGARPTDWPTEGNIGPRLACDAKCHVVSNHSHAMYCFDFSCVSCANWGDLATWKIILQGVAVICLLLLGAPSGQWSQVVGIVMRMSIDICYISCMTNHLTDVSWVQQDGPSLNTHCAGSHAGPMWASTTHHKSEVAIRVLRCLQWYEDYHFWPVHDITSELLQHNPGYKGNIK